MKNKKAESIAHIAQQLRELGINFFAAFEEADKHFVMRKQKMIQLLRQKIQTQQCMMEAKNPLLLILGVMKI